MLAIEDELDIDTPAPPDIPVDEGGDDGDGYNDRRWVTVATFWQSAQVHIARLRLESEDIDCVLIDENLVATDWLLAPAVGGIKLQVREADVLAAREALSRPMDLEGSMLDDSEDADDVLPSHASFCPECGSDRIGQPWVTRHTIWAGVVALMLSGFVLLPLTGSLFIAYLIMLRPHRCGACGHHWAQSSNETAHGFPIETPS